LLKVAVASVDPVHYDLSVGQKGGVKKEEGLVCINGSYEGFDVSRPGASFRVVLYECFVADRVVSICVVNYAEVCLGVERPGQFLEGRHEGVEVWRCLVFD
jgi:tRNA G37 N-methylase TrmD